MISCIVGKKIGAVASGHLELFPFVVLAICVLSLMAMASGINEHMLTSWSSMTSGHFCWVVLVTLNFKEDDILTTIPSKLLKVLH